MAGTVTAMSHNKHMDIKYKYVNEYVENSTVKTVFVKSAENYSNNLTKNLYGELYKKQ